MNLRRHPVAAVLGLLVLAFLWLPLLDVLVNSVNRSSVLVTWGGVTAHWYRLAAADGTVRAGLQTTLVLAVFSTLVSLVVAVSGALWWRRAPGRGRAFYDGLVYARIIVPEVVFASALFFLFLKLHVALGIPAMIVGHVVLNSAYCTLIIQARMAGPSTPCSRATPSSPT